MGRRRTQRTDNTLRQLLLAYWRSRFGPTGRWHIPGRVSEYEQALMAGEAIVVDSSTIMCALNHAGLPGVDDYAFGGRSGASNSCSMSTARSLSGRRSRAGPVTRLARDVKRRVWQVLSVIMRWKWAPTEGAAMGRQPATTRGQVDVTYVKRGQVAAITRMRPETPSKRAQEALARAASRRGKR
jgi:hypothetical protein